MRTLCHHLVHTVCTDEVTRTDPDSRARRWPHPSGNGAAGGGGAEGDTTEEGAATRVRPVARIDRRALLAEFPDQVQPFLIAAERVVLAVRHAAHRSAFARYLRDLAESVHPSQWENENNEEDQSQ